MLERELRLCLGLDAQRALRRDVEKMTLRRLMKRRERLVQQAAGP
jgi:hypothetical protein